MYWKFTEKLRAHGEATVDEMAFGSRAAALKPMAMPSDEKHAATCSLERSRCTICQSDGEIRLVVIGYFTNCINIHLVHVAPRSWRNRVSFHLCPVSTVYG